MERLLKDLTFAFRQIKKSPGFTLIAILSLALGIGANTSIFSLFNTVLLRPLPVYKPEEITMLYGTLQQTGYTIFSYPNYKIFRDNNQVFSGLASYRFVSTTLNYEDNNEKIWGYLVTGNYFDVLGIKPQLGRWIQPQDDINVGASPVVVITYNLWQRRFNSDPNIIGKEILLSNYKYTVIGVAPKDFIGTEVSYNAEVFFPMMMAKQVEIGSNWLDERDSYNIFTFGRLKTGFTKQQAEASLQILNQKLMEDFPKDNEGTYIKLSPMGLFIPEIRESVIAFSWILMGIVSLVILLACVNLANLLLAKAITRRKEIAVRLALGATRFQLIRQLLTESIMLSVIGGVLGLIFSFWINDFVSKVKLPTDIAIVFDLRFDWRVFIYVSVLSVLTGVIFGLLPAIQASKPDILSALKDEVSFGGFKRFWLRNILVAGQVALSLILLVCGGLIIRSLQQAQMMRPGFSAENTVSVSFDLSQQGYDEKRGQAFYKQALEKAKSLPGVESVTLINNLPLSLNYSYTTIYVEGQEAPYSNQLPKAVPALVYPKYFETMKIALHGRDFTENDKEQSDRVLIVNEALAHHFFPNEDAIGKRINFSGPQEPYWTIIGVCENGKYNSLNEEKQFAIYRPLLRSYDSPVSIVVRTKSNSEATLTQVQKEVQQLDPKVLIYAAKTLKQHLNLSLFPAKVAAIVLGSFALLALTLAIIGIYGVMTYAVSQRIREIAVRMALGASTTDILKLIVGQGMKTVGVGVLIGIITALMFTKFLSGLLYGVSATDPITFIVISLLLGFVALIACLIPAIYAVKTDPMVILRQN